MSQYYNSASNPSCGVPNNKPKRQKSIGCKKCGKKHEDGCFDTGAAVRRQFIKEFNKFMED